MISDRRCYLAYFKELAGLAAILKISLPDLDWFYPGLGTAAAAEKLLGRGCSLTCTNTGTKLKHVGDQLRLLLGTFRCRR